LTQWFTFNRIDKKIKQLGFTSTDLVIQDKPALFFVRKFINTKRWIYRATDDYSSMSRGAGAHSIQKLEQEICNYADRGLVTSAPWNSPSCRRYSASTAILRNGGAARHFTQTAPIPREYQNIQKPITLYGGSLDDRSELDFLLKTAEKTQSLHYMIVGPG